MAMTVVVTRDVPDRFRGYLAWISMRGGSTDIEMWRIV